MRRGAELIALFDETTSYFTVLAAAGTQTIVLERALPVIPFYDLWLGVRCHNRDFGSGTRSMIVEGFTTVPTDEDPAELTSSTAPKLSAMINRSTTAPSLAIATATGACGMHIRTPWKHARSSLRVRLPRARAPRDHDARPYNAPLSSA